MSWKLITHGQYVPGSNGGTSPAFDILGVDLLIVQANWNNFGPFINVTDDQGNTYTEAARANSGIFQIATAMYYVFQPVTNAALHFTITGTASQPHILFAGFSGAKIAPLNLAHRTSSLLNVTSINSGVVGTPSQDNSLWFAGWGMNATGAQSIDSGFTILETVAAVGGNNYSGGIAYLVQGVAAALSPTVSWSGNLSNEQGIEVAVFKPSLARPRVQIIKVC